MTYTGDELKALREAMGLSVDELVEALSLDPNWIPLKDVQFFIKAWERGEFWKPNCEDDRKRRLVYLRALGVSPIPPLDDAEELESLRGQRAAAIRWAFEKYGREEAEWIEADMNEAGIKALDSHRTKGGLG